MRRFKSVYYAVAGVLFGLVALVAAIGADSGAGP